GRLRSVCAWVADRSTQVRVQEGRIDTYAASLAEDVTGSADHARLDGATEQQAPPQVDRALRETEAAYWLTLDAINFGSGWFPTLRKRSEQTGYRTIAAGIRRRFEEAGRWTPPQLTILAEAELADWLEQDPEHELIGLFVQSLNDLGANIR